MRGALIALALFAPLLFPWPLTAALGLLSAIYFPLAPLMVGFLTDALYYTHGVAGVPWWTFLGLLATVLALYVRGFVETSIMRA